MHFSAKKARYHAGQHVKKDSIVLQNEACKEMHPGFETSADVRTFDRVSVLKKKIDINYEEPQRTCGGSVEFKEHVCT